MCFAATGRLVDILRQGKTFSSCYLLGKVILSTGPLLFHFCSPTSCLVFFYFNLYLFYVYGVFFLHVNLLPIEARRGHPLELELWWP